MGYRCKRMLHATINERTALKIAMTSRKVGSERIISDFLLRRPKLHTGETGKHYIGTAIPVLSEEQSLHESHGLGEPYGQINNYQLLPTKTLKNS